MSNINVGCVARDRITGFKGVVIARTEWLNGCVRVVIQPQELKDGKPVEAQTFDVQQIELVKADAKVSTRVVDMGGLPKRTGGPTPDAARHASPRR